MDTVAIMKDKVALVTGASKGIGAGIAKHFAVLGANVIVNYHSAAADAQKVVGAIEQQGGRAVAVKADVSNAADVARLFAEADRAFGRLDVLVNNAGVYGFAPFSETSLEMVQRMITTNLYGPFLVMQEALKRLGKGGSIINISSGAPRAAMPTSAAYAASKAALDTMTHVVAKEAASRGIRVNTISPGPTLTEGAAAMAPDPEVLKQFLSRIPMGRFGEPADIAAMAGFLASDAASWITGENFHVTGGS